MMLFIFLPIALILCGTAQGIVSSCSDSGSQTANGFTFTYERDGDNVNITASVETDTWVAIGFSADTLMPATDVGVGASNGSTDYFLDDRYNTARTRPPFDDVQNFENKVVTVSNGTTTISFTRPVVSTDTDQDISLDQCRYVLWAYGGSISSYGSNGQEGVFGGHSARGVFSSQICLCDGAANLAVSAVTMVMMVVFTLYFTNAL